MIQEITDNIIRISFSSVHTCNAYYIKDKKILIDTGTISVAKNLKKSLPILSEDIVYVFFTHLHYDHIGAFNLFFNARQFASKEAIESFKANPAQTIYDTETVLLAETEPLNLEKYDDTILHNLGFEIIKTPGHTNGSICLIYEDVDKRIIFSGDTVFNPEMTTIGRTDLPTSSPRDMQVSLRKISTLKYDIMCPGHGKVSYL